MDNLKFWESQRDDIAAGVQHQRIDLREGTDLLAVCEERIREHRDGIVETEEQPAEVAPAVAAVSNFIQLRPAASHREIRDRALAKYRADMKQRTGRDPLDASARASGAALATGLPMMICPAYLLLGEDGTNA